MAEEHTDMLIHIRRWDEKAQTYPVEATLGDGDFFSGGELRLDQQALLAAQLESEAYGLELFYALFSGPIRRAYDKTTGRAEAETGGHLRVRLWIDAAATELHARPWERIYHVHKGQPVPLATSALTPFSRYVALPLSEPEPITTRPVRLLIAISNPDRLEEDLNLTPLDVGEEVENLHRALGDLRRGGQIQVTLLPGRSELPSTLRTQLEDQGYRIQDGVTGLDNILRLLPDHHVLHFVGHGFFRHGEGRGKGAALYLEREDGRWEAVGERELTAKLATTDPLPHLIFLSACESGMSDVPSTSNSDNPAHPFVGLAPSLVKAGIPAVVAMQDQVPIDVGRELARDFYRRLLEHGTVDRALNEARGLLFERQEIDWAIPVLFMRLEKGRLFTTDPIRLVLQAIQAHEPFHPWSENEYLPIEVVHLMGDQDPGSLAQVRRDPAPSLNLVEAAKGLFSRAEATHRQRPAQDRAPRRPRDERLFIALVGDHGTAKSTQLRRLAWLTAEDSLGPDAGRQVIPVYVDLVNLEHQPPARSPRVNPIQNLILESLRQFWPDLTAEHLSDLLERNDGPTLRILIDGSDDLPDTERHKAWRVVRSLARDHPRHEYMLAVDPNYFDPQRLDVTDLLVIQPLSPRKVEQFLKGLDSITGRRLYGALSRAQLFDLAASPWLLIRMLNQAREGIFPRSRTEVLRKLVEDAMVEVPSKHGMRSRADRTLYTLAWRMQSAHSSTWPVSDTFRTMAAIRGNREYSLEDLYDALARQDLLARVGEETMRFAYPAIQAYCCAQHILHMETDDVTDGMENRDQVLDNVTATLGRLTRLRWWEGTLILLSGLMEHPGPLIRMILYGAALGEGEQVFLAARCLLESESYEVSTDLVNQVVDALVWRLDSNNERSVARRIRAAQTLGQLGQSGWLRPSAGVPHLARAANQKVRLNWREELTYEYSSVRMAAAVALQRLGPTVIEHIEAIDSQLAEVMALWKAKDVEGLGDVLHAEETGTQSIAAFALGKLQTKGAVDLLVETFLEPEVPSDTRWAVTDALALLDPAVVTRRAILPLLDEEAAEREEIDRKTWNRRNHWYERMAYLAGKIRAQHPEIRAFLDRCLYEFTGVWLKAKAIRSLGSMYARGYKELFEQIAVGDFGGVALRASMPEDETVYLRRKAIQALAHIGDRDTLTRLRANRTAWCPELERALYRTSEEIRWRLSLGHSYPAKDK